MLMRNVCPGAAATDRPADSAARGDAADWATNKSADSGASDAQGAALDGAGPPADADKVHCRFKSAGHAVLWQLCICASPDLGKSKDTLTCALQARKKPAKRRFKLDWAKEYSWVVFVPGKEAEGKEEARIDMMYCSL